MLKFENLVIRKAHIDDAPLLTAWWNNGEIMAHAGFPDGVGVSVDEVMSLIKKDTDNRCHFMIDINEKTVGEMHYYKQTETCAEIGIKICDVRFRGKGFGKKLLSLFIQELFDNKSCITIRVNVAKENRIARHVYEQLGFQKKSAEESDKNAAIKYELSLNNFINYLK